MSQEHIAKGVQHLLKISSAFQKEALNRWESEVAKGPDFSGVQGQLDHLTDTELRYTLPGRGPFRPDIAQEAAAARARIRGNVDRQFLGDVGRVTDAAGVGRLAAPEQTMGARLSGEVTNPEQLRKGLSSGPGGFSLNEQGQEYRGMLSKGERAQFDQNLADINARKEIRKGLREQAPEKSVQERLQDLKQRKATAAAAPAAAPAIASAPASSVPDLQAAARAHGAQEVAHAAAPVASAAGKVEQAAAHAAPVAAKAEQAAAGSAGKLMKYAPHALGGAALLGGGALLARHMMKKPQVQQPGQQPAPQPMR